MKWTDTLNGSALHEGTTLLCQVRRLGVGGWSAGWRNGMKWDVSDQLNQVEQQVSKHFLTRIQAKQAGLNLYEDMRMKHFRTRIKAKQAVMQKLRS